MPASTGCHRSVLPGTPNHASVLSSRNLCRPSVHLCEGASTVSAAGLPRLQRARASARARGCKGGAGAKARLGFQVVHDQ